MTPWDQGPGGVGQQGIYEGIEGAEKHVVSGSNHSTIFDGTEEHNRVVIDFFMRHSRAAYDAHRRGVRRRADPAGAQDGGLARPLRHQLHVLPQPRHVRARRPRRRRRWSASVVGRARDGGRPGARLRDVVHRRPAGRGLWPHRPRADAGAPRLLGLAPPVLAVPRDRGDVLVRGAGADGGAGHPGALRRDDRRPAAPCATCPLHRRDPCRARDPRLRRHALAAEDRAAGVARADRDHRRPVFRHGRRRLRRGARVRIAGSAAHVGRLRDLRDGDVRSVAHARREHLRLLPLYADTQGHAHRPRGLGTRSRGGHDIRRRVRRGRHRGGEPVHRRGRSRLERRSAGRPDGRDRRPGPGSEHHERLHGRAIAGEHRASAGAAGGHACRRRHRRDAVRVPRPDRGGAAVDHAPRQLRCAAHRRRACRLPRGQEAAPPRGCAL